VTAVEESLRADRLSHSAAFESIDKLQVFSFQNVESLDECNSFCETNLHQSRTMDTGLKTAIGNVNHGVLLQ
jgi:hypothetical protein